METKNNKREKLSKNISPTAVDIYSGAGGLSLGFKMAGFTIAVAVDMDEAVKQTYTHNNPEVEFIQKRVEK